MVREKCVKVSKQLYNHTFSYQKMPCFDKARYDGLNGTPKQNLSRRNVYSGNRIQQSEIK